MVKKWKYYSSSTFETNSNKLSQMLGENSLELLQGRWIKGSQNHQQCPASVQRRSHAALGTALLAISQNAFLQHPATQCWFWRNCCLLSRYLHFLIAWANEWKTSDAAVRLTDSSDFLILIFFMDWLI